MAMTLDGNRQIVILAFAVVKSENADAWGLFYKNIARDFPTVTGVITDGAKGAVGLAVNHLKRDDGTPIVHGLCSQHIMENANNAKVHHPTTGDLVKVNATDAHKDLAWRIIKGTSRSEVARDLRNLRDQNLAFYTWLADESRLPKCALFGHALNGFCKLSTSTGNAVEAANNVVMDA